MLKIALKSQKKDKKRAKIRIKLTHKYYTEILS